MAGWQDNVQGLKGVGPAKAACYHRLGIDTLWQLVHHFPRDYLDFSHPVPIGRAVPGEKAVVRAQVLRKGAVQRIRKNLTVTRVTAFDGEDTFTLQFFNARFAAGALQVGREYLFYGAVEGGLLQRMMRAPQVFPLQAGGGLQPVYPVTEGLTSRMIAAHVRQALEALPPLPDPLPAPLRRREGLMGLWQAICLLHSPQSPAQAAQARRRLAFDELLVFCLALEWRRRQRMALAGPRLTEQDLQPLWQGLAFVPTDSQRQCAQEIGRDMASGHLMSRLVAGDVGSGKTLVAAAACYQVFLNGGQSALMAPTELLAAQHFESMGRFLAPLGMRLALLTGSTGKGERQALLKALQAGQVDLLIGTHALISAPLPFARLWLVVTDEQHRFGVGQRGALGQQGMGVSPHMLVMSATPIPRTLAMVLYGDLDISQLRQMPRGRKPVLTYLIGTDKRQRAYGFLREQLRAGGRGYIVCPAIEEGENTPDGMATAEEYARQLAGGPLADVAVGVLHGRMKPALRRQVMGQFAAGQLQLLVSTTVIEVGVDVPEATVMMVESADRFGLSQLHQLRGRVGRSDRQSYCILVSDSSNPQTLARLRALCKNHDGFAIAEEDLRLRGPGDFLGSRQHGLPLLAAGGPGVDEALLGSARAAAGQLLEEDCALQQPGHQLLGEAVRRMLAQVGLSG